jgi:hypothetical protein
MIPAERGQTFGFRFNGRSDRDGEHGLMAAT